jgi:phosphoglycerate dehydrogenase-like enzyme
MPQIEHVLITIPFNTRQVESLVAVLEPAKVTVVTEKNKDMIEEALETTDVAFIRGQVDSSLLNAPRLKWIHCNHAGLEKSAKPELFKKNIILTSSAGRSAPALAEHALMFVMAMNFGYPGLYKVQLSKDWKSAKGIVLRNTPLSECTLGIIGTGHTGKALARRAKSLEMRVEGYRRRDTNPPNDFDCVYSRDANDPLDPLLQRADFLVLAAPLTNETRDLISYRQFTLMKSRSVIINIARGALIDEKALIDALDRGLIAGAGLDVFTSEPLPNNSPLWGHPKVLITPHARPGLSDREDRVVQQLVDNINLYRSGSCLYNQLSENDIYTEQIESDHPDSDSRSEVRARAVQTRIPDRTKTVLKRLNRKLTFQWSRRYPLRPLPKVRRDIVQYRIDESAYIEVFWKELKRGITPTMSLFVGRYEVLRFDCSGPRFGHFHVADNSGFYRIQMFEQQKQDQIERSLFEIEKNCQYFLRQNPRADIRNTHLEPDKVSRACAKAKYTLMSYADYTDSQRPDCAKANRKNAV